MNQPAKRNGFTLVEIMIVVMLLAVLIAIGIPNFMKARETARLRSCVANLRQIYQAKEQYAMASGKSNGDVVCWAGLVPDYVKVEPTCPMNGVYDIQPVGSDPQCTIPGHVLQ